MKNARVGLGRALILSLPLVWLSAGTGFASARSKNEEGNRLYQQKKYGEALKKYTEAQLEAPDAPQLHYNLGNVLFRQGEIEKARDEYLRALAAADRSLDPKAVYNLGNSFLTQQQYREAIEAYRRTLKLAPEDRDAKRNLELALRRLEQQRRPQSGGDQPENRGKPQKDESASRGPTGQGSEPKEKGRPESAGPESDEKKRRDGRDRPGSLTREEAERILNALQEDEKANLKKSLQAARENPAKVDQDW